MSIFVGSTEINEIQLGGNVPFESVYVGADKVFSRPLLLDITVGFQGVASGTNEWGYDVYGNLNIGALSYAQAQPSTDWFNGEDIVICAWQEYFNVPSGSFAIRVEGYVSNSDSAFTTLKVNNLVLNRTDANFFQSTSGTGWTVWQWSPINTNPWSGAGNTDRVRFERDV